MLLLGEGQLVVPAGGPVLHPVLLLALLQFIHSHLCYYSASLVNTLESFEQTDFSQWPPYQAGMPLMQTVGRLLKIHNGEQLGTGHLELNLIRPCIY